MSSSGEAVAVSILGKRNIGSPANPAPNRNWLAQHDFWMRACEVRGSGKVIGTDRIAVMVALNLAHNELLERKKSDQIPLQARQQAHLFIA